MADVPEERRRFQRLDLPRPVPATFRSAAVRVLEVSLVGVLVEHATPLTVGEDGVLEFEWGGETLRFECAVARTVALAEGFQSGLEVRSALGESDVRLRRMIAEHVARVVAAQEANAFGARERNRIDADHTLTALGSARRAMTEAFVTWRFRDRAWKQASSLLPDQPADGFTVAAWEEDEQIERLRAAYETADAEGRRFIRMLAELSISEAKGIPPRRP
ncbi:MAG: PilZ domain-containing protein [Thermoanaerobaculia bacterium]